MILLEVHCNVSIERFFDFTFTAQVPMSPLTVGFVFAIVLINTVCVQRKLLAAIFSSAFDLL